MLSLYRPAFSQMEFRQKLLADPETMTYNHAWGGTIDFPEGDWPDWYARWVGAPEGGRFYRYLRDQEAGAFVGEAYYRWDEEEQIHQCGILVLSQFRGRWFGTQGLELLCAAARENGVELLYDDIAADNPAVEMFLRHGFQIVGRTAEYIRVRKDLLLHRRGREGQP